MNLLNRLSWKTTLAGVVTFVLVAGPVILTYVQTNNVSDAKQFWTGLGILVLSILARDNNKSSEQVGAGVIPPPSFTGTHSVDTRSAEVRP